MKILLLALITLCAIQVLLLTRFMLSGHSADKAGIGFWIGLLLLILLYLLYLLKEHLKIERLKRRSGGQCSIQQPAAKK